MKYDDWDYLKDRAELAGLLVIDEGASLEFRARANCAQNIDCQVGSFQRATDLQAAATWLMEHDVNLPNWH